MRSRSRPPRDDGVLSTALRISLLETILERVSALRDLPDDDPAVLEIAEALVVLLGAQTEPRAVGHAAAVVTSDKERAHDSQATVMQMLEQQVRRGLTELQASRSVSPPVQWLADQVAASKLHRQLRAEQRRPIPPSREGRLTELRIKLQDN